MYLLNVAQFFLRVLKSWPTKTPEQERDKVWKRSFLKSFWKKNLISLLYIWAQGYFKFRATKVIGGRKWQLKKPYRYIFCFLFILVFCFNFWSLFFLSSDFISKSMLSIYLRNFQKYVIRIIGSILILRWQTNVYFNIYIIKLS